MILSDPIKKLPPNAKGQVRFRFVVDVGTHPATGKRKQLTRTFGTLREAKTEYARITVRSHEGTLVPRHTMTVNEWLDQWLAKKAEDLEASTISTYRVTLDRVRGRLGHIRLQELTEDDVEAWMLWALREGRVRDTKAGPGLGVTSVEMSLTRLKEALNRAVTRGLVAVNVAQEVTIPRKVRKAERRAKAEVPPWSVAEVRAFVLAVKDHRLYAPFLLSLMGLRPAEVCGMRWADLDLDRATLAVANTRTLMRNTTVVEKDTKSLAGERSLPLPAPVREALRSFKAAQAAEKLVAGQVYRASGYVLVDDLGAPLDVRQLREQAYKVMAGNALRRVRLYDARASCFTYLANHGVPDHLLARWAGHADVRTTKHWYVKPDVEDLRTAADVWSGLTGLPTPVVREM
ncbi:tyrosine-type recombinase/integrase [Streptomyces sp. NPDC050421]|uniref:tyrosine-type recombinase/integrase n=1 Tax=unclassified Streptomyces TaxID=2593676 RepID=UPI0037912C9D